MIRYAAGAEIRPTDEQIYDPESVRALFDEMAATYGIVNLVTSFGFSAIWRRATLEGLGLAKGAVVADLMSGRGELWPRLSNAIGSTGSILAVDLSSEMIDGAPAVKCRVRADVCDVLKWPQPGESCDAIVCSFGLKTFNRSQQQALVGQVQRILRPGGVFSFVEISVPKSAWLRRPYLFYLTTIIPYIGRVLLGNPENYRMLGVYTEAFGSCSNFAKALRSAGLQVVEGSYFFGCATGVRGRKPAA